MRKLNSEIGVERGAPKLVDELDDNNNLCEYIDYYRNLENPGYAILVTGAWGVGKTYQVKKYINKEHMYYVSLFGVNSLDGIHNEVLAEAYPDITRAKKIFKWLSESVGKIGGLYSLAGAAPGVLNAIIRRKLEPNRILVFDDLERSKLPIKDVIGVINSYVEHQKFKVVVIAHEDELEKEFIVMKEKLFGQIIRVRPNINDAFDSFARDDGVVLGNIFVQEHKNIIIDVFERSGEMSLRVLRHLIKDIERLHRALLENHTENIKAMERLVSLFSAFDIEVRAGNLTADDLQNRRMAKLNAAMRRSVNHEELVVPPLLKAEEKYAPIDLGDTLLSDDVLTAMFIEGRFDEMEIRRSLDNSAFFIKPADDPPWKIVINFDELEDDLINDALERMEKQFVNRDVIEAGEILHIFALRLMLSEEGVRVTSLEQEFSACQLYIDDLLMANILPPCKTNWRGRESFVGGYGGYGYWITPKTKAYFDRLMDYLVEAKERALENTFPGVIDCILEKMVSEPEIVSEMISSTNNGDNPYAFVSLLYRCAPEDFVAAWLAAPRDKWRVIYSALQNRYDYGRLERELKSEREWALSLYQVLLERISVEKGLSALRIKRIIPQILENMAQQENK